MSYLLTDDWQLRASAGRGVRFSTVAELFLGTVGATQITRNDPTLQPEKSDALELTAERHTSRGRVRVSLFQDDVRDTIWNQVNVLVFPARSTVQNIDRVRTRGVEAAFTLAASNELSLEGSVAYAQAKILRNDKHPEYVGNDWPRIPDWRGSIQAAGAVTSTRSPIASRASASSAVAPFTRDTLAQIERKHAGKPFWVLLWDLECGYCMKSLSNLAKAQRERPDLQVVTIATDSIDSADQLRTRLKELGVESQAAYAFAGGPPEALRFAIDQEWLGEKPRAYRYDQSGKRTAISGVIGVEAFE